ncbi:MAG: FG-GAP-like repeat-containing protein [Acidobacteriota bacterium]
MSRTALLFGLIVSLAACRPSGDEATTTSPSSRAFVDATAASGLLFVHDADDGDELFRLPEEMGPGGALLDHDGDADLDVFLVQGGPLVGAARRSPCVLYENDGQARFRDVTAAAGAAVVDAAPPAHAFGAAAADVDADGDVDLLVTRLGPDVLLVNDGSGRFTDATERSGLGTPGFSSSAAFFDADRDGRLDLYVCRYVDWSASKEESCFDRRGLRDYCNPLEYRAPMSDRFYRGRDGGVFQDRSEASGVAGVTGHGLGVVAADFDDDGWPDLYVANDQTPAFVWMNRDGGARFVEDAGLRGAAFDGDGVAIAGMGVAAEDLDGDLDPDLLVTNIHHQSHLGLINERGLFSDRSRRLGLSGWAVPYTGFGIALFDQDHDGSLDGFIVNGAVNRLTEPWDPQQPYAEPDQLVRMGESGFVDASDEVDSEALLGVGRGVMVGDLDGDGDLDLVVTNNRGPARLLLNQTTSAAWCLLSLRPAGGGRHAIGAEVVLHAGGRRQLRAVRPHAGYLTSNDPRVHFGLADATRIDRIDVTWPTGEVESWTDLPASRWLELRQGASPQHEERP